MGGVLLLAPFVLPEVGRLPRTTTQATCVKISRSNTSIATHFVRPDSDIGSSSR